VACVPLLRSPGLGDLAVASAAGAVRSRELLEVSTVEATIDRAIIGGWEALRLANDRIDVVVIPAKGAEIWSVTDRRTGIDVLWKAPWELRPHALSSATAGASQTAWLDHYAGGWQVLFPNGGDAVTYRGADLGFHGEASVAPWTATLVPTPSGAALELSVDLRRSPFRMQRRMELGFGASTVRCTESITNLGADRLPYMWGHHPAYGAPFLGAGARLTVPAATYLADASNAPPAARVAAHVRSSWPHAGTPDGGTVDVSLIPGPEAGTADMGYILDLEDGWYALESPMTGLGLAVAWPRAVLPCLWLWQEFRGGTDYPWYGRAYVMGVEPHSSWPGHGLLGAIEAGTARWIEPRATHHITIAMTLFSLSDHGMGNVDSVNGDGTVRFVKPQRGAAVV
jgi:hypothetical protein